MTIPTIDTTLDELNTEQFWAEKLNPITRAAGLPDPTEIEQDRGDLNAQLLRSPTGELLAVVRTGPPVRPAWTEPPSPTQQGWDSAIRSEAYHDGRAAAAQDVRQWAQENWPVVAEGQRVDPVIWNSMPETLAKVAHGEGLAATVHRVVEGLLDPRLGGPA